jgi:ribonuclease P protein component
MLTAGQRLRRREDFTAAVRGGRRVARGCLVVHLMIPSVPGTGDLPARAGFVIPRAVGTAVARNKIRRRLRHLLRDRLRLLPPGTSVVIRALPSAARCPYPRLAADLDAVLAAVRTGRSLR